MTNTILYLQYFYIKTRNVNASYTFYERVSKFDVLKMLKTLWYFELLASIKCEGTPSYLWQTRSPSELVISWRRNDHLWRLSFLFAEWMYLAGITLPDYKTSSCCHIHLNIATTSYTDRAAQRTYSRHWGIFKLGLDSGQQSAFVL